MKLRISSSSFTKQLVDIKNTQEPIEDDGLCRNMQSFVLNGLTAYVAKIHAPRNGPTNDKADICIYNNYLTQTKESKKVHVGKGILYHANGLTYHENRLYVARAKYVSGQEQEYQIVKINPNGTSEASIVEAGYKCVYTTAVSNDSKVARAITYYEKDQDNKSQFIIWTNRRTGGNYEFAIGTLVNNSSSKLEGSFQISERFYVKNTSGFTESEARQDIYFKNGTLYIVVAYKTGEAGTRNNCIMAVNLKNGKYSNELIEEETHKLYVPADNIFVNNTSVNIYELQSICIDTVGGTKNGVNTKDKIIYAGNYQTKSKEQYHGGIYAITNIVCNQSTMT